MIKIIFYFFLAAATLTFAQPAAAMGGDAAASPEKFYRAQVSYILEEGKTIVDGEERPYQKVQLKILDGDERGRVVVVEQGKTETLRDSLRVKNGERVVLVSVAGPDGQVYYISDKYRLPSLGAVMLLFFALVIVFGRLRGFSSLVGLVLTVAVLVKYIIPQIIAGRDPLLVTVIGAVAIIFVSMYLAHGFNRRTSVALASALVALFLSAGLAYLFVALSQLFGTGSEEAFYVARGSTGLVDFRGLLLAGILIGVLGVLDDITTGQAAAVDEIAKANPLLPVGELYRRGTSVGREHIASLVNTLVLAYAGASLPLFILFTADAARPLWVTLNSETMAEEIVRTLVGSSALILAVPLTTILAAYFLRRQRRIA